MKCLTLFAIPLGLMSCQKSNLVERQVELINDIGVVEVSIPPVLDGFHEWIKGNDYRCGDRYAYRFQSSYDSMWEESQFISILPERYYFFTISHLYDPECDEPYEPLTYGDALEWVAGDKYKDTEGHFYDFTPVFDYAAIYHEKVYAINGICDTANGMIFQKVKAVTVHNGERISFELLSRNEIIYSDPLFFDKSIAVLRSIRWVE